VKALFVTGLPALLLVACASEPPPRAPPREAQSYDEAVRIMCEVDTLAGVDPEEPLDAEAKRSEYLVEHVKNSDGIYLLTLFRTSDPRAQASLLGDAVRETACRRCPLLAILRTSADEASPTSAPPARP
jgi:hypothetical protein